ncbi:hypothetical protein Btru_058778 [Bulinus truncatus]|nr:hypothetical protein Btru_058778 [Bulinus truncatus]
MPLMRRHQTAVEEPKQMFLLPYECLKRKECKRVNKELQKRWSELRNETTCNKLQMLSSTFQDIVNKFHKKVASHLEGSLSFTHLIISHITICLVPKLGKRNKQYKHFFFIFALLFIYTHFFSNLSYKHKPLNIWKY